MKHSSSASQGRMPGLADVVRGHPRAWLSPRRKRFWVLLALIVYTLVGFLLAPWIAKRQALTILEERLARPVRLDEVRMNPYALSVEARGFAVSEPDGSALLGFERLYVNFQLRSLFHWAWTFREITLEQPSVTFVRLADGTTNLGALLDEAAGDTPTDSGEPADGAGLPRLIIDQLNLLSGRGQFRDNMPLTPFEAPIGPIDITLNDVSTLPDERGRQRVQIHTERGANLAWQGTLQIAPLHSEGRFTADGPFLPLAYRYFQDVIGAELVSGSMTLAFDYEIGLDAAGDIDAAISDLDYSAADVLVTQDQQDIFKLPALHLRGGHAAYPERQAGAAELIIRQPELLVWREADGSVNVQRLLLQSGAGSDSAEATAAAAEPASTAPTAAATAPESTAPTVAAAPEPAPSEWALGLDRFEIADLEFTLEDRSLRETGRIRVNDLDLTVDAISNQPGARFPTRLALAVDPGGSLRLAGEAGALPAPALDAELTVDALALAIVQPYLGDIAAVDVEDGHLDARIDLEVSADEPLGAAGELSVDALSVAETAQQQRLLGWGRLAVDRFVYSQADAALALSELSLDEPFVRLLIAEDRSTNFAQLVVRDQPMDAAAADTVPTKDAAADAADRADAAPEPTALHVTVGRLRIATGAADFTDLSLPLPFHSDISNLHGEVSTIDSASTEPSAVDIEGQIADYGLARIQGELMPLAPERTTDIQVLFRNVALPDLTPYTIRFAGREIDSGRMEVALDYEVDNGRLVGRNSVVISELALGERVEHPDAFNLPLALAVALLKGPDGTIDVDVPVEGDVNDPEFRIGGVILKAVVNLITNIVTSPFRLLGGLVGADADELGELEFEPGSAELTPPEREKLTKLAEALSLRPQLTLEVTGVYDPEADLAVLKEQAVAARIDAGLAAEAAASQQDLLDERRRAVLESLFTADFPDTSLTELQASFRTGADADTPDAAAGASATLDQTAYVAELERRLVQAAPVGEAELRALGTARAEAVAAILSESADLPQGRVAVAESAPSAMTDSGWIPMELAVQAGATAGAASADPSSP